MKRLGFVWVTLDDGWQNNVGDWALDPKKFPRGDADMKALVDRIHQEGFSAQLWWSPLSAVPNSELLKDHPDYELLNRDGSKRKVSWWNSYYLCPADHRVVEYHKALVRKILVDWGFDGLKLDGQDMNGVPACYNPAHHHEQPEESVEALPDFFRADLRNRASGKARGAGGVLPLRHGIFVFHHAAFQYVRGFRPGKFLSGPLQGKNVKGPDGRQRSHSSAITSN